MEKIDKKLFKRLRLTLSLAFISENGGLSMKSVVLLLVLLTGLMEQFLAYFVGLIASGYYKILIDKDWQQFGVYTLQSFILVIVMVIVKSTKQFMAFQTNIVMRQNMTRKLHLDYMSSNSFCYLNIIDSSCDNPDQRITKDVEYYCLTFSNMVPLLVISPFTIGYYTYQTFETAGWTAPALIAAFFVIATIINKFFINATGKRVFLTQREEGNLRHKHSELRANAESCAYYGQPGSEFEQQSLNTSLHLLILAMYRLSMSRFFLDLASSFWEYSGSILTYIIIAVPIQAGVYDHLSEGDIGALISKNSFVCMYLIYQFTSIIGLSDEMAGFVGVIHRIGQLCEHMDPDSKYCDELISAYNDTVPLLTSLNPPSMLEDLRNRNKSTLSDGTLLLRVEALSVTAPPPDSKILISNLNLDIEKGSNLLISGPSGCGKTSLFRTLAGIWPVGGGEFNLVYSNATANRVECLFFPQMPYLTVGTIADNLVFPFHRSKLTETDEDLMKKCLHVTGLHDRVMSINQNVLISENNGGKPAMLNDIMSPGEIQRFMFARLLFHAPLIAFLDEPTSSLDEEFEHQMFEACILSGITLVTIAHRPERLATFHSRILKLSKNRPSDWILTSTT